MTNTPKPKRASDANRKPVYVRPTLREVTAGMGISCFSAALDTMAARYRTMVAGFQPDLAAAEWCAICSVLDAPPSSAESHDPEAVAQEIRASEAPERWGVEGEELAGKVAAMTPAQIAAVQHYVDAFWALADRPEDPVGDPIEALRMAGVRIPE